MRENGMVNFTITENGKTQQIRVSMNSTIMEALHAANSSMVFACGGNHSCGKCIVRVSGNLSPLSQDERALLGNRHDGARLACFARLQGDAQVIAVSEADAGNRIALDYTSKALLLHPIYEGAYGAAVDIGTTTLVGYLFSHNAQEPISVEGVMNRQRTYGADVLSRIDYANQHGVEVLQNAICSQIGELLMTLCGKIDIRPEMLSALVITGNTTMLHLAAGLAPRTLALAPFTPVSLFDYWAYPQIPNFTDLNTYFVPCISAYVGGDITCGILASDIAERQDTVLLVDVGTNGEMVLCKDGALICCSTAAGPAFEGAGISAGMSASRGAINKVWVESGKLRYTTIESAAPIGLCGSGLIDAVYAMLQLGLIERSGRIPKAYEGCLALGDSGINLTQADVRQLQLAKGAIRAGMDTLLHKCCVEYSSISEIILCGGFGSFLDPQSAEGIGLLPDGLAARTRAIGNAAGAGAGRILQSHDAFDYAKHIAAGARTLELSYSDFFRKRFVSAMAFNSASINPNTEANGDCVTDRFNPYPA